MTFRTFIGALAATTLLASPLGAAPASSLSDLVGARGGQAEGQLEARGFTYITGHKDAYSSHTYWWHDRDDNCVHVTTTDGRYASITDASRSDCNRSNGNDVGTALAVGAGVAILGALIAGGHKKHHHDDNRHLGAEDEAHYERGYQDGIHHYPYHNADRSNAYSNGYEAGVAQRDSNSRHHSGRGGYAPTAQYRDLVGARATASDELTSRGFAQVDNFTSGNTRYSIRWNRDTRQCLQVTIADGRLYDIRDIGQHPRCR